MTQTRAIPTSVLDVEDWLDFAMLLITVDFEVASNFVALYSTRLRFCCARVRVQLGIF